LLLDLQEAIRISDLCVVTLLVFFPAEPLNFHFGRRFAGTFSAYRLTRSLTFSEFRNVETVSRCLSLTAYDRGNLRSRIGDLLSAHLIDGAANNHLALVPISTIAAGGTSRTFGIPKVRESTRQTWQLPRNWPTLKQPESLKALNRLCRLGAISQFALPISRAPSDRTYPGGLPRRLSE
jgi:hypothetical protein